MSQAVEFWSIRSDPPASKPPELLGVVRLLPGPEPRLSVSGCPWVHRIARQSACGVESAATPEFLSALACRFALGSAVAVRRVGEP